MISEINIEIYAFYVLLYIFLGNSFKSLLLFICEKKGHGTPPFAIRISVWSETIFGVVLLFLSLSCLPEHKVLSFISVLTGAFFIWLAQKIYYADKRAKNICLILSIVRIPTLFGIPFSVLSIINLLLLKSSKNYFNSKCFDENSNQKNDEIFDKNQEYDTDRLSSYINCTAKTITAMKPSGYISLNDKRFPAITEGDFIETDTSVIISKVKDSNFIVRIIEGD